MDHTLPQVLSPPAYRLHSPDSVALATALGTPAAGGIVLALNYWKWGQKAAAAAAVAAGILTTAVIFWLAWVAPGSVPAAVFLAPQVLGGYFLAKRLQERRFGSHLAAGGRKASNWLGAGIGLALSTLLVGGFIGYVVSSGLNPVAVLEAQTQQSVDMGHDQYVYYSHGTTREDARRLGEALKEDGYFDDTAPAEVWMSGPVGAREISFFGGENAWDVESNVQWMHELAERIAPDVGGSPLTVRLLDEYGNERRKLLIECERCGPGDLRNWFG